MNLGNNLGKNFWFENIDYNLGRNLGYRNLGYTLGFVNTGYLTLVKIMGTGIFFTIFVRILGREFRVHESW